MLRNFQINFITNTATIRWMRILIAFETQAQCSTHSLAEVTDSTTRTIVTDITDLKEYFGDCLLITSSHQGYNFSIKKPSTYMFKKRALIEDEILFHIIESIFHCNFYNSSEWAEKYHISESTVIRYLRKVQPVLSNYNIDIQTNPVNFSGNEINIRKFFHDFYYESEITAHTIFPPIAIQEITASAFSKCHQINEHACSFGEFNYYLYVALERHFSGKKIMIPQKLKQFFKHSHDFSVFSEINSLILEHYSQELPEEEIMYLFSLIKTRRSINDLTIERKFCKEYNHWNEIRLLANRLVDDQLPKTRDKFRDQLLIESFFTVAKIKQLLSPLLNHVITDTEDFVAENFSEKHDSLVNFLTSDAIASKHWDKKTLIQLGYSLTIYIESIKSLYWRTKINVAFLFEGPYYLCQYLKCKSVRYLRNSKTFFFPDSNELSTTYLEKNKIDLVVTNYSEYISDFTNNIDSLRERQ